MNGNTVWTKSTKQKLNAKSSTEAELIAVSDALPHIIWTRDLLLAQGYPVPPTTLFQDNLSTITMIQNGRGTSPQTRYIAIRFFWVKDRVDSGDKFPPKLWLRTCSRSLSKEPSSIANALPSSACLWTVSCLCIIVCMFILYILLFGASSFCVRLLCLLRLDRRGVLGNLRYYGVLPLCSILCCCLIDVLYLLYISRSITISLKDRSGTLCYSATVCIRLYFRMYFHCKYVLDICFLEEVIIKYHVDGQSIFVVLLASFTETLHFLRPRTRAIGVPDLPEPSLVCCSSTTHNGYILCCRCWEL